MNKPKLIQFQVVDGYIYVLLDSGKMFREATSSGGPTYWEELDILDEIVEYYGKKKIT